GMAKEAKYMRYYMSNELTLVDSDLFMEYSFCQSIRNATEKVLTMLEDDFGFENAGDGTPTAKSEKLTGTTPREMKCQESDPKQKCSKDSEHSEKDNNLKRKKTVFKGKENRLRNNNSNNEVEKKLKEKRKLRKDKKRRLNKTETDTKVAA
ncbi:hypothetical protein EJB05_47016, partial [Eragrostis curvula]